MGMGEALSHPPHVTVLTHRMDDNQRVELCVRRHRCEIRYIMDDLARGGVG